MLAFSLLSEAEIQGHTYISTSESREVPAFSLLSEADVDVKALQRILATYVLG